ncbi:MAG: dihydrodipicolinate synthase family protein [Planctomycetota bacterium]|jgi:4-hydroxy-tetrahydrodipicolinate synthase
MKTATVPKPLCGIIPPMVTPLEDRETLDVAGLERLIEHILSGGVNGLFILGTTGEGPSLGYRLRHELIDRVAEQVAGRVPLLVGITDTAFVESVEVADYAADAGAAAVVLSAPPYFPISQAELVEHVERMAADSPLPLFLYNMPSHTKVGFDLDSVERLMDLPGVVGLKDSSANLVYFHRVRRLLDRRPHFSLLVGPEELLAETVLLGGNGGVCGGANLDPRLYVDLYRAARAKDLERTAELHDRVMRISETVYSVAGGGSGVIKGIKCVLSRLGISSETVAEPLRGLTEAERRKIHQRVDEMGLFTVDKPQVR